jgi:hypothetical protein
MYVHHVARSAVAVLACGVLGVFAAPASAAAGDAEAAKRTRAAKKLRLVSFPSCKALVRYGRRHAPRGPGAAPPEPFVEDLSLQPPPLLRAPDSGPVPSPPMALEDQAGSGGGAGGDSGTNVQEAGVDEPDIVKSADGRIFAVTGDRLHSVAAAGPSMLDSLDLEGWGHQLLLSGDRLLVISQAPPLGTRGPHRPGEFTDVTVLTEVDVSDPTALAVLRTERIRGVHVTSRLTGHTARVVVWSRPRAAIQPALRSRVRGWLPRRVLRSRVTHRRSVRQAARCGGVLRPASFSGTGTLTVLTVDLSKGLPAVDSDAVLSGGHIAYASATSLYVATPAWTPEPQRSQAPPEHAGTLIHRFDISDPDSSVYRSSGRVPGYLLNQFSMAEHGGVLRVASTEEPSWWPGGTDPESESRVTTLDERSGALVELGHAGGLGKGERIYAVRFIGDRGYVVTFRQTDPLYTLDLSKPSAPKVAGELKILGYSAYLHPVDDDLLLGVGQDAGARGRLRGTQLSLFDIGDPAHPRRLHQRTVQRDSSSDVEYDHHAFLWWGPSKLAVLPLHSYAFERDDEPPFSGAIGFGVDRSAGITERGRATHDQDEERYPWPIERSFVLGGHLFTLSQLGLEANSLQDLSEQEFLPFPR